MGSIIILLKIPTRIPNTCSVKFVLIINSNKIRRGFILHASIFWCGTKTSTINSIAQSIVSGLIYACCLSMFITISCFGLVVNHVDSHIV